MLANSVPRLLALLLALGLVLTGTSCSEDPPAVADAKVGDCVVAPESSDGDWEQVDCGSNARDYAVLEIVDAVEATEGVESVCTEQRDFDLSLSPTKGEKPTLCLQQTPEVGECIDQGSYVDCDGGTGAEVIAVLPGTDTSECPRKARDARVYQADKTVVCVRPVK